MSDVAVVNLNSWTVSILLNTYLPPPTATITGAPSRPTKATAAALAVGGTGVVGFIYKG